MSTQRLTHTLMGLIAILLLANLIRPIFEPVTAFAQSEDRPETAIISGSGSVAWILKNNQIYYVRWDSNFRKIQIEGPRELDLKSSFAPQPVAMTGTGNSAWVLKGDQVYYIAATVDQSFVNIDVERPEKLPEQR